MDTSRAVFLSYASQDSGAARRISDALRAAGIEVWFDQSELRGGDVWDQKIRRELRDCALFVPVISTNTAARQEGYFRLEWDLADQRSHMMARNHSFIVPVCVDATPETCADVPESFLRVQWTRLPGGEMSTPFLERIQRLLSGEAADRSRAAPSLSGTAGATAVAHRPNRRRAGLVYGAIAAAAMVVLGYVWLEPVAGRKPNVMGSASIAVLPFANESGETSQQYFSDGISEDLITALSQFSGLKVIGRTSAFQFRNSKEDTRSIGAKLGVAHLLVGSVRRSGEMVRVSTELIDTVDGSTQWSQHYDRPYKDLFALQDQITRAVAGALKTKLLPGEHAAAQSERPRSGNLEAYNALLQGRFYSFRGTEAGLRQAIAFFTQATQLDPRYALAWSESSRAWTILSADFLDGQAAQEAYAEARAAADRALTLAPDLAAAHNARGDLLQLADFDWRGAEAEYRRALALAPDDAQAKFNLGTQLAAFGELKPAIELTRQALVTEPLRASFYKWLGVYLLGLHRLDEAKSAMDKAIELQPGTPTYYSWLTNIEIVRGDAPAALEAAQQVAPGSYRDLSLALALQIGIDRSAADAALRTLIEKDADTSAYQIAEVYALRNDPNAAFKWLDRAWSNRDAGITNLLFDPFLLRYKGDPRFAAFCRNVGLPVPGEESGHAST